MTPEIACRPSFHAASVGYPVARLGGQLSGGEIARPTSAGRSVAEVQLTEEVTSAEVAEPGPLCA
jgi:hypothetical protein